MSFSRRSGPYVRPVGNTHYLVGVTSFGPPCGTDPGKVAQIPGNEDGYGWIQSVVCGQWEEESSICPCRSDCDCQMGLQCVCVETDERRLSFLEKEQEYSGSYGKASRQDNRGATSNKVPKGRRRLQESSGKDSKACMSVKCGKSSKSGNAMAVCRG